MKIATCGKWYNGESFRLFPNIEIDNCSDTFYISITWLKLVFSIGLESE